MNQASLWTLFIHYVANNYHQILFLTWQHIEISLTAVTITVAICLPVGIYISKNERPAAFVIGIANIFETIPSLALLAMLIFVVGIGPVNAIIALVVYAILPVIQNTYTGIKNVPESAIRAGRGVGMTEFQILWLVQLPLARPVIIAGIRVATVWTIGTATLAAAIGAGGLGRLIFAGLSSMRNEVILAGAIPATLLALVTDQALKIVQEFVTPKRRVARLNRRVRKRKASVGYVLSSSDGSTPS